MNMLVYPEVHLKITGVKQERNKLIWTLKEDAGDVHTFQTGTKAGPRIYRLLHIEHMDGDPKKHVGKDVWASRVFISVRTEERDLRKFAITDEDELKILPPFEESS